MNGNITQHLEEKAWDPSELWAEEVSMEPIPRGALDICFTDFTGARRIVGFDQISSSLTTYCVKTRKKDSLRSASYMCNSSKKNI